MAAMSSGKTTLARKLFSLSYNLRVIVLTDNVNKCLPCCYATNASKSASVMMQRNQGSRTRDRGKDNSHRSDQHRRDKGAVQRNPSRAVKMKPESTDWPSVFPGPQGYNPAIIPVFLRMGRKKHNRMENFPNRTLGNLELMKIPNFFHLTPPAIERHCDALKNLCKPWPADCDPTTRPLRVTTRNYLFAGPSLYHPGSRKVKLQVCLKDLILDDHARRKLIELVATRYDSDADSLTIVTDKCPTRKQNKDYAMYLLTVLYNEAWRTEPWEAEADQVSEDDEEIEGPLKKRKSPIRLRLIEDKLYRFNKDGKGFKLHIKVKV